MTIEKPNIQSTGDIYILHWPSQKVKMRINRILESPTSVSGEVIISLNSQGADSHLYHARLNMLSAQSKKALANELTERVDIDWQTMIEQATVMTLKEYRRGEETISVGNLPIQHKPRFRLKPFILENELSAIYGYGGSGKSSLTDFLAILVQCGTPLLGIEVIKGNTLILDWESSPEVVDEITKAIKRGMGITDLEVPYYRRCHRILANEIFEIQTQVVEKNIKLVIVDSAGMASGLSGDFHSSAIDMLRALRSLKVSVLLIDHKPKDSDSMFGSVYKTNECRSTWEVRASQEEGSSLLDIGLFHTKHNYTQKFKPWGFEIEFTGTDDYTEQITFQRKDVLDIPELSERLSAAQRIIKLLGDEGNLRPKDISSNLNIPEGNINTALTRLKKVNKVTKLEDGSYGLLYEE